MLNCRKITILVSEAQDRELTKWESFSLGAHFQFCWNCKRYAASVESLRDLMDEYADLAELPTPPEE